MEFCGIEKLSLLDFDNKLTCTLFMAGCPFRCPFCHNASLVFDLGNAGEIPFSDILAYLKKRQGILEAVCVTGGEATMMPDLEEKIKKIKELGYCVKLDTNGSNPKMLKSLIEQHLVDYVAMDIKNSKENYLKTIGLERFDLSKVFESVDILLQGNVDYEFRTTIIEEFHTDEDMKSIATWIKGCKRYRLQKYVDREGCIKHGFHEIKKEKADSFLNLLKDNISDVSLRGY